MRRHGVFTHARMGRESSPANLLAVHQRPLRPAVCLPIFNLLRLAISVLMNALVWPGDGKVKRGAAIHHPFRPDPAAVPLNDPLDVRQADARALELIAAVQALKHAEQFAGITRIETRAVVADKDHGFARRAFPSPRRRERNRFRFWPGRDGR